VKLDYAAKGVGIAFETEGIQSFLFIDSSSSGIFYIFMAVFLADDSLKRKDDVKRDIEAIEEWGFSISMLPGGIFIRGEEDGIYDIMKDYREYNKEATVLVEIIERMLKAVKSLGGTPGPYYSSYVRE